MKQKLTDWRGIIDHFDLSVIIPDRMQQLITIMERVRDEKRAFNMHHWQAIRYDLAKRTEQALHECGTAACMGGWVGVSPEFQAAGGRVNSISGEPMIYQYHGSSALMYFLSGGNYNYHKWLIGDHLMNFDSPLYNGIVSFKISASDVLERLGYIQKRISK